MSPPASPLVRKDEWQSSHGLGARAGSVGPLSSPIFSGR